MNTDSLAFATISWARNEQEATLLTTALTHLSELGHPLFITDAGSPVSYLQGLSKLPGSTILGPVRGVWQQAKSSLEAAAATGAEWIFYAEPDKAFFFAQHLSGMLQEITVDEQTGIIIAARSAVGFASFPAFQQMTETTINRCCAELIGSDFDYVYGPFLMRSSLVPYLNELPANIGWGWRPYAFLVAHRLGLKVRGFEGNFLCPEDQRQDDRSERVYRMRQLAQNMEGLALAEVATL
jgi:hypothetical protein